MLIPCNAPMAEVISAYLEAGDLTSSSRATYRRVLGELARDLGPQRPADSVTADELAAWFVRTRDAYAGHVEPRPGPRPLIGPDAPSPRRAAGAATDRLPAAAAPPHPSAHPRRGRPHPGLLLREKTLWTAAYDSAARASELLGLDVGDLDLANRRAVVTSKGGAREWVTWSTVAARLLPRLLKARREGPLFLTRAPSRVVVAAVLHQAPDGTAELSAGRGAVQGRDRVHAASASPLRADAPGGGRRFGADADDQGPAPVDRQPRTLRPPVDRGAATV
jgi:integrase